MSIQRLLLSILEVYTWLILVRVVLSFVNPRPTNEILQMVVRVTEPVLGPLRKMIPMRGLDFSPLLAYLLIRILMNLIA